MAQLGETVTKDFTTHNPLTGQVQDADFLPGCQVFSDDVDVPVLTPPVVKRTGQVGDYRVTFDVVSPIFHVGGTYDVIAIATVAGIEAKARIYSFNVQLPNFALIPL